MILRGRAHVFGDDINTDYIISSKQKAKTLDIQHMAAHIMEDVDPEFAKRLQPGDFIVAGRNFGCGSSRETAPRVIQAAGLAAVLAVSYSRIFFRNSINVGLPVFRCDTSAIETGDEIEINLEAGTIHHLRSGAVLNSEAVPKVMLNIVGDGGLAAHVRKHGTFCID